MTRSHIWRAAASGSVFANPVLASVVNSMEDEFAPVLGNDILVVYWASTRRDLGARGGDDIWRATRARRSDPWTEVTNVAELNTGSSEVPDWLSPDGCRLYFHSDRAAPPENTLLTDIYVAERAP